MSGDCLRGYPQPTPLAPAQVWPGLDLGFLVDFYALGYTKTKGDLPTGLTAAKTITEAGFWVRKTGLCLSGTLRPFLAVVLGVVDGKLVWMKNRFSSWTCCSSTWPLASRIGHTLIRTPQLIGRHADRQTDRRWEMTPCPLKGTNPALKKPSNIPEIYAKMFGRFH